MSFALKTLPEAKAARLTPVRIRRSNLQKVARARRDDPDFPWADWADLVVNETLFLAAGSYRVNGERQSWAAPNAEASLCYGKNSPFQTIGEVDPEILAKCRWGAEKAIRRAEGRRCRISGAELGNRLNMTHELREELKAWSIWPAGATQEDLDERSRARAKARRAQKRARDAETAMERRRRAGATPRSESAERLKPWEAMGISRRTYYRRKALPDCGTNSSPEHNDIIRDDETVPSATPPESGRVVVSLHLSPEASRRLRAVRAEKVEPELRTVPIDTCEATDAAGLQAPCVIPSPPPPEPAPRWDWWRQPVPGWREGRLEIRNIVRDETTVIQLRPPPTP